MRSAIILAAGKGTRMKSSLNKVMHQVSGKPMIRHITDNLKKAEVSNIVVVVGHGAESVKDYLKEEVSYAEQKEQLGTGHAVMQVKEMEEVKGDTIILCGDAPCISKETIEMAFEANKEFDVTVLTAVMDDAKSYGRIVRNAEGFVDRIVEAKDATDEELAIKEINTGIFCFKNEVLFENLKKLTNDNAQGEYYLTDLIEILNNAGKKVNACVMERSEEAMGVNDRIDLANAQKFMRERKNREVMLKGVTLIDPMNTYIDEDVEIGEDSIIYPNVYLYGNTKIGKNVTILPGSYLMNAVVHENCTIDSSKICDSEVYAGTTIGPFSHLRNHTVIHENVRIGNFVEFKNSDFGVGSKCAHLTYIGDSDVGANVNVGCGVVTVNYDGKNKYRTTVKDGAFIGSNCNLIAPVTIGENALLAAGSTITQSVEDGDMGIARARQSNKEGFGTKYKNK